VSENANLERIIVQYIPWGGHDWADSAEADDIKSAHAHIESREKDWAARGRLERSADPAGHPKKYRIIRRRISEEVLEEVPAWDLSKGES
jgi:hypothetical protein